MQTQRVSSVTASIPEYNYSHSFPEVSPLHQISDTDLRVNVESEEVVKVKAESTLQFNL